MVNAARASATSAAAPPCPNQSLAKHNRKPSQLTENNHQRPKSIASFCRTLPPPPQPFLFGPTAIKIARNSPENNALNFSNRPKSLAHVLRVTDLESGSTYHLSPVTQHFLFLIGSRPLLEIELTHSQQTRKYFLTGGFSATSAPAPQLNSRRREFLTATNLPFATSAMLPCYRDQIRPSLPARAGMRLAWVCWWC
jgi:hypothetical protein